MRKLYDKISNEKYHYKNFSNQYRIIWIWQDNHDIAIFDNVIFDKLFCDKDYYIIIIRLFSLYVTFK